MPVCFLPQDFVEPPATTVRWQTTARVVRRLPCVVPCMMLHACVRSCWLVAVKTLTPATILSLAAYGRCDDGSGPRVQSIDGSGNNVNVRGACECTASTHMFVRQPITFPSGMSNADLIERAPATLALACV